MSDWNPWKLTTIGMALVAVTALITGLVVAGWNNTDKPGAPAAQTSPAQAPPVAVPAPGAPPSAPRVASAPAVPAPAPSAADVAACNAYAKNQTGDKTTETIKDALIGAAGGAGLGAAGGAIAGGGKGAGKGTGIGGLVGAAAGTLYGLNEAKSHDARYVQAYRACMRGHGHAA